MTLRVARPEHGARDEAGCMRMTNIRSEISTLVTEWPEITSFEATGLIPIKPNLFYISIYIQQLWEDLQPA